MHAKQYIGILLKQYLDRYPKSKVTERKNCFTSFCDSFNHLDVHQLTTDNLKKWFDELKVKYQYTSQTMMKVRASLNHFFDDLITENIIPTNPIKNIKFKGVHKKTRERVVISPDELSQILQDLKQLSPEILYPYIFTLVHTGARRNEIRKVKWKWIDFKVNHIYLPYTKNGSERRIPMSSTLATFLKELHQKRGNTSEYVFINQWQKLLSEGQILDTLIKFQKLYPQKRWRPHDLRHSFAHNYLKKGGDMYALQALLGHKSIRMTIDLYGQVKASDVKMVSPYD